jgi:ASPIC and UnbV/FG-GAP-like repeat
MRMAGALLVAGACAGLAMATASGAGAQADGWFEPRPLADPAFTLDDLGVVDYDSDRDTDIFTTNHLSTQLLLTNDGSGSFQDRLTAANLNQTPAFPGWDDDPNDPDQTLPGLYIYRDSGIVLHLAGAGDVTGELRFLAPTTLEQAAGAQVALRRDKARKPPRTVADFSMGGDSTVRLKSESTGLPLEVAIDAPFPLSDVFVGHRKVSPSSREFTLYQRDRHGMAWADYNRDGVLDVFINRGGVSGKIGAYRGIVQDELQLGDGSSFHNAIAGTGISKGTCRGRAAGAVDFNRDGRLDVFADCFGASPRLFRQRENGSFKSVSAGLDKSKVRGSTFEWVDVDGRGGEELIAARRRRFVVYERHGKRWERAQSFRGRHDPGAQKLTVADYDNDGDPDMFAAARSGSSLVVNKRGRLRSVNPKSVGLPPSAMTANWVDYDNDGLTDLHLIPGGLFRQLPGNRFTQTGLALPSGSPVKAIAAWADFNADGSRDAALALRQPDAGRFTELSLLDNVGPAGHWLQVELTGPPANRQALGAKVSAGVAGRVLTQWVGQNEGSHLSQGHYRLYFGLGAADAATVKVTWPDGTVKRLGTVGADRIVRVRQG